MITRFVSAIVLCLATAVSMAQTTVTGVLPQFAGGTAESIQSQSKATLDSQGNFSLPVNNAPSTQTIKMAPAPNSPYTAFTVSATISPNQTTNITALIQAGITPLGTNLGIPNAASVGTNAQGYVIPGAASGLPSAPNSGQGLASTAAGTTYAAIPNVFYSQNGDSIASIESQCSSPCTYVVTGPQTITLGSNHTLSSNIQLQFTAAGLWTVNGAFTLTLNGNVTGTLNQHFAGSSTIAGLSRGIPVEWFGAIGYATTASAISGSDYTSQIQKTLNSITGGGWAQLQPLAYQASSGLAITTNSVGIRGVQIRDGYQNSPSSIIVNNSATVNTLTVQGTRGTYLLWNVFKDFAVIRSTTPTGTIPSQSVGFYAQYAGGLTIDSVTSNDSLDGFYFNGTPSFSIGYVAHSSCSNGLNIVNSYISGTINCFDIDSSNGVAMDTQEFLYDTGAVLNTAQTNMTSRVIYIHGTAVNDVDLDHMQSAGTSYGAYLNYTGSGGADTDTDIHFNAPTFDGCGISCVYINGFPATGPSALAIENGYLATSTNNAKIVDIESSHGVILADNQCLGLFGTTGVTCFNFANSTQNVVLGNKIFGVATGMAFDGSSLVNDVGLNSIDSSVATPVSGVPSGTAPSFLGAGSTVNGVVIGGGGVPASASSGLVENWFSQEGEGSTLVNSGSDFTNAATGSNITWTTAAGFSTPVATYNGTSSIATATSTTSTSFTGATPFSVCVWANLISNGAGTFAGNLNATGGNFTGWEFSINIGTSGFLSFFLVNSFPSNSIAVQTLASVTTGATHFLCVAYNGNKNATTGVTFYIDGFASASNTIAENSLTGSAANTNPVMLGSRIGGGSFLNGVMGRVKIWNRLVTSSEISAMFSAGSGAL
jgi:hypothetical protein